MLKLINIGTNEDNTHIIINILGIKFSIKKKDYAENYRRFNYFKKNNIDITTFPKATGQMRDIQLANLKILMFFDKLCKENNLTYWLDFGTLLGAVRHKGYIPWDDDIDISMMREDYEKVFDIVNNNKYDCDIYAEHYHSQNYPGKYFHTKIKHKKYPYLFVDIFPSDFLGKVLTYEEQQSITEKFKEKCEETFEAYPSNPSDKLIRNCIKKAMQELTYNDVDNKISDIVWGIDFKHRWSNWVHPNKMIFPLKKIKYEGFLLNVPNDYDAYLKDVFGNYMDYPKDIKRIHSAYMDINENLKKFEINTGDSDDTPKTLVVPERENSSSCSE